MKKITAFLIFVLSFHVFGQKISSSKWTDLFSYNNIVAIREDNGRLITATENGVFFYTPASGEITKLSKANGLHEVKISAFDYNPETKIGLVGYKNGALDVITPDGITYVVDIPIATGYNGEKKINHISITGNFAVISVGYGVSIFRLDKKEFGDSAFFINSGIYQEVKEAVIKDNAVYAATSTGLKSHSMPDPTNVTFPIYNTWTTIASGDIKQVATGGVIAYAHNNKVYYSAGGPFSVLSQTFSSIQDVVVNSQNLIVANGNSLSAFDFSGNSIKSLDATEKVNTGIFTDSKLYAGTKLSGIINEYGEHLKPDGPYNNISYKIDIQGDKLLISSGARESYNNAIYNNLGYYHFDGAKWIYPELFKNSNVTYNVLDAVINPAKLSEIFFTNYSTQDGSKGIYKMNNDQFVKIYKSTGGSYNRVVGCTFDEDNQLFVSVWSGGDTSGKGGFYYYNSSIDDFNLVSVTTLGVPQKPFSHDGILYIFSAFFNTTGGLLIYDYNKTLSSLGDDRFKLIRQGNNLPADGVVSAALDQNDDLWIGTRIGLRILQNPSSAIDEANTQTEPIIIEENGVGEELFRDGQILQIEVDSGNQKWVSVDDGGVFYLSPNGEQTLTFFNRANSPLPTNNVTDIKVDKKTGKVYFVTLDGVVVYQGDVLTVTKDFGDVLVYPNPVVYAQYKGNVSIRGLAAKTNIRITDAAGNLVHQAVARGGSYEWNLANHRGVRVASGIYFVLMTNEDGTDTATAKIAVVN